MKIRETLFTFNLYSAELVFTENSKLQFWLV